MTYALIDNATLSAVQRVTGEILTKSKDSVDIDILALENLVQAILFFDQIVAIDDYIPAFRDNRVASFPFVRFLSVKDYGISEIEKAAAEKASAIRPEIRGGEFANEDFRELIGLLQAHIICTWDVGGSVYHLTLKCLADAGSAEFDKYGNLAASIFAELGDATEAGARPSSEVKLVDRFGNPITTGYVIPGARSGDGSTDGASKAILAFVAALTWLANRSIFYSLTAKALQADTFLHPIRQNYQQIYISKTCGYGQGYPKEIVNRFSTALADDIVSIHQAGLAVASAIDLPIFSAWLAKETGDAANIVRAALEIRNDSGFVEAREQLRAIRSAFDADDLASANKNITRIVRALGASSTAIRCKYGLETRQGVPVTRLVHVYNTVAAVTGMPVLPEYDFSVKMPAFLRNLQRPSGFNAIYRNISNDLATVWALGEARDILGARVHKDKDAIVYSPKNEAPRYRYAHSRYKSPM